MGIGELQIRPVAEDELSKLAEIDRSEHVRIAYRCEQGKLLAEAVDWHVPPWSADEVAERIARLKSDLESGACAYGAFDGQWLAGLAVLGNTLFGPTGDWVQLIGLWVSCGYRRRGIASRLLAVVLPRARALGAHGLYISATPSESAVGFYASLGAKPAPQADPELYTREPEDIHLLITL